MQRLIRSCFSAIFVFTICILGLPGQSGLFAAEGDKPNIILILIDDLAESDLGCFGNSVHSTPHIDRLFSEGLHFTNGYASAPICSASRAALMTGKTTARLRFEFVTKSPENSRYQNLNQPLKTPSYPTNLPLEEETIPELLKKAGYETAFFGKWHLNQHYKRYLGWSPVFGPLNQGFENGIEDFGSHPYGYWKKKKARRFQKIKKGEFPEDSMTSHAIDFLKSRENSDKPFFLMVSHFYVHTPVHTRSQWLHEKYDRLLPREVPNRQKRVHYAAFVETMDHYVGHLLDTINASGLSENTLIVLTSDNGGHPEYAENRPYRGSKWNLYEGGIRVPFVIRRPVEKTKGQTSDVPVVGYDLLPTFCKLAGLSTKDLEIDGQDIFQLVDNPKEAEEREIVWHFPFYHPESNYEKVKGKIGHSDFAVSQTRPQSAIRVGKHKLLHFYESESSELYSLDQDKAEETDSSQADPEMKKKLTGRLKRYLESVNARIPEKK